jgi:hypothetical protein
MVQTYPNKFVREREERRERGQGGRGEREGERERGRVPSKIFFASAPFF